MTRIFKSANGAGDDGWTQMCTGSSAIDNEDYYLTTHYLKADEVPEAMTDAKTASQLIAGLLNAYYNGLDVTKMNDEQVMALGVIINEDEHNPNQLHLFDEKTDNPF